MRFITINIFTVTSSLVSLAIAKPTPNWEAGGIAIPLTRHSSSPNFNESIDLDAMTYHGISIREKIFRGLDNYEMNTGIMHPFAVKRSESGLERRGVRLPLTYQPDVWMTEISIGTPPKTFSLQIGISAADTWVLETGCQGISPDHNSWDPNSSQSAKDQDKAYEFEYRDGHIVQVDLYTDNMTIAGFTADPQHFGSAYRSDRNNAYADGLLGLAFPSISNFGVDPLFASLFKQGKLTTPIFSLKLTSRGAEMYVGGVNSRWYSGNIAYTRITAPFPPGLWLVSMDDVRVNNVRILTKVPAIIDTAANLIFGDRNRVSELYERIGGTLQEHGQFGYYHMPCDSFPTLSFTFGGTSFRIPPEVLRRNPVEQGSPNCFSAIAADHSSSAPEYWVIGMPFLQGVYSVFNYVTFQVGFARLVGTL